MHQYLAELARESPAVVCGMHRGLVEGVLEAQLGLEVNELEVFARPDVCVLRLRAAGAPDRVHGRPVTRRDRAAEVTPANAPEL